MNTLSTGELESIRTEQESAFQDVCKILTYSSASNDYGELVASYSTGASRACAYNPTITQEDRISGISVMTLTKATATLRLPISASTDFNSKDRIQITKRHGSSFTREYAISGSAFRLTSCYLLFLEEIVG